LHEPLPSRQRSVAHLLAGRRTGTVRDRQQRRKIGIRRGSYCFYLDHVVLGRSLPLASTGPSGLRPIPPTVRVSTGEVVYNIGRAGAPGDPVSQTTGRVIVQVLDDQRIRVEYSSITTGALDFTSSSRVYAR